MPPVFMSHSVRQRQVQQSLEQRAAERQHHPHVQQSLAIVLVRLMRFDRTMTATNSAPARLSRVSRAARRAPCSAARDR